MKITYFLRGLGVGIMFAAVLLFAAYKTSPTTMTDEEIISRAKELGMVEGNDQDDALDELFSDTTEENTEVSTEGREATTQAPKEDSSKKDTKEDEDTSSDEEAEKKEKNTKKSTTEKATTEEVKKGKEVSVTIVRGMSSEEIAAEFEKLGIVDDAKKFNKYLCEKGYDCKLITGKYTLTMGEDYSSIVSKISR